MQPKLTQRLSLSPTTAALLKIPENPSVLEFIKVGRMYLI